MAAGAKLVDFAGWEMPVSVRGRPPGAPGGARGLRRSSTSRTWARSRRSGPQALELLQRLLSNDVSQLALGGAQYSVLCREDGGVLDDLFTYRLDVERYLTVTNASNHARDLAWFRRHAGDFPEVQVSDRIEDWAMLAVQGPLAREFVQAISDSPLPARMTAGTRRLGGAEVLVCGTGYTGEDGVELLCAPEDAPARCGMSSCAAAPRRPASARATRCAWRSASTSTATTSAVERGPIEAGLGWCCKEDTGFIGAEAVRAVRAGGSGREARRLRRSTAPGSRARATRSMGGGEVTSGTLSPCLEVGIGMAYVPAARAAVGTRLEIDVRGKMRPAVVKDKPLYRKGS